jgi:uncharacterized surface protein with fasciclin (FAS1) repeats
MNNLYDTVASFSYLSTLKKIIDKSGMADILKNKGPFTLFAPYEGAFSAYTTYDPDDLLHEFSQFDLDSILASEQAAKETLDYILVPGLLTIEELSKRNSVTALNGLDIPIDTTNGNIIPGDSFVLNHNIECTNGIIHVTDELLQPSL